MDVDSVSKEIIVPDKPSIPPVPAEHVKLNIVSSEVIKKNKNKLLIKNILWALIVLVLFGVGLFIISNIGKRPDVNQSIDIQNAVSPTISQNILVEKDDNLSVDSDTDGIPDVIETGLGFDPKSNDCVRNAGCGEINGNVPRAKLRLNVVFVIDVSGSMNADVGGQNKWESVKTAMTNLLSRRFPKYMDVGVVMYGHLGSSSEADKQVSCNSVEVIKPLASLIPSEVSAILDNKSPNGWTPLGASLQKAGEILKDRSGEANYIVVLSDGQETCGGDPVMVAQNLYKSGIEVTTNVVGLALTDEEKKQLEAIAKSGGGNFFPADQPSQLERALSLSTDALLRWEELNKCIAENVVVYSQCISTHYIQAVDEVRKQKLEYQNRQSSVFGGSVDVRIYSQAENNIWQFYNTLKEDNWLKYKEDLELVSPR